MLPSAPSNHSARIKSRAVPLLTVSQKQEKFTKTPPMGWRRRAALLPVLTWGAEPGGAPTDARGFPTHSKRLPSNH